MTKDTLDQLKESLKTFTKQFFPKLKDLGSKESKEYVIECTENTTLKVELNENNVFVLDRAVCIPYPSNYGEVKNSKIQEDGDYADFFLISDTPLPLGLTIEEKNLIPLAHLVYLDKGEQDDKFICTFKTQVDSKTIQNLEYQRFLVYKILTIKNFLQMYKPLKTNNKVLKTIYNSIFSKEMQEKIKTLDPHAQFQVLAYPQ